MADVVKAKVAADESSQPPRRSRLSPSVPCQPIRCTNTWRRSDAAARYVDGIVTYSESLVIFPKRGIQRDDLQPGQHITSYRHSAVIAFLVDVEARSMSIIDTLYAGRTMTRSCQSRPTKSRFRKSTNRHITPTARDIICDRCWRARRAPHPRSPPRISAIGCHVADLDNPYICEC